MQFQRYIIYHTKTISFFFAYNLPPLYFYKHGFGFLHNFLFKLKDHKKILCYFNIRKWINDALQETFDFYLSNTIGLLSWLPIWFNQIFSNLQGISEKCTGAFKFGYRIIFWSIYISKYKLPQKQSPSVYYLYMEFIKKKIYIYKYL